MKLFPNKNGESANGLPDDETIRKKKEKRTLLIVTLLNTILLYGLYLLLTQYSFWMIVAAAYMIALGVVSFAYVFYNRGFTRKNVTVEMLPEQWSDEEKEEYVADGKRRLERSKWCLTILFPLVFTFFMDLFYFYVYEPYFSELFGRLFS